MRGYTRHQLKQDRFAEATKDTVSWAVEHRQKLVTAGVVVGAVALIVLGAWYWMSYREGKAETALSGGLRTYQAPLRPAAMPADPDVVSYTSSAERAKAANEQFRKIADTYGGTNSGKLARYLAAVTERDLGQLPQAEADLKKVIDSGSKDLASLARLALAGIYRDTGRQKEAIGLYNELIAKPTDSVAKSTAQLELADLYAATQPVEARRIYEQIRKDAPTSAAAELAAGKMAALK